MLSVLPLFALALALPAQVTKFCETRLYGPGPPVAFARLEVDRAHAVVGTMLLFSTRHYKAAWSVEGGSLNASSVQTHLSLPTFALSPETPFPVTLTFLIDGREVLSRTFEESTVLVVHSGVEPPPWTGPRRKGFYPGVEIDVVSGATPSLFGARSAELVGTTADGERIGVIELPLPAWDQLTADARKAFAEMEAKRMQRKCDRDLHINVSSSHGR